ncbi:SDR family NAD(P)-dependent oxidoreductase [Stigmatella hybrida]|uniref:SDR family NAD(P)-dependent oxidoreductase n=1 Tax=Stigmatella hybrida TaxID=394097 RepID=UPI001CDADC08|nr:SDR family NAD(P)-dependent oxidoreductase [Stigmatella hybrida]
MAEMDYRTALVAGASSKMGHALALWFARRGIRVYLAARNPSTLAPLIAEAEASGADLIPMTLDITDADATRERIRELDVACGGLDLVMATGLYEETCATDFKWDRARRIIDTNVTGAAALFSAVLPQMVERNRGHLVGIAGLAAYRGLAGRAAYSGSKAFLSNFLESLRVDLQGTGLRVTCVYPGYVRGELKDPIHPAKPFVLETEDAADRIGQAILRGKARYTLPWQAATLMRLMQMMPGPLFDASARWLR